MEPPHQNTGSTSSFDGETMILTTSKGTQEPSIWTTQPIASRSIPHPLVAWLLSILPTICTPPLATGSQEFARSYSKQ